MDTKLGGDKGGDLLLLHGTKPGNIYDILFKGLDPGLCSDGLFGKGVYLAEDAAKIDQYITKDPTWKGNDPEHELHRLRKKLYQRHVKHGQDVFYALVCRVCQGSGGVAFFPTRVSMDSRATSTF